MRYRSFAVYCLFAALLGTGFALVWIAATGEYRPPIWVTCLAAIGTGWIADVLEQTVERRHHQAVRRGQAHASVKHPVS